MPFRSIQKDAHDLALCLWSLELYSMMDVAKRRMSSRQGSLMFFEYVQVNRSSELYSKCAELHNCLTSTAFVLRWMWDEQTIELVVLAALAGNGKWVSTRLPGCCLGKALAISGFAVALQWLCSGFAVALQWLCSGFAVALQWLCSGFAVALQWLCCHDLLEYVVAVDRICQVQLAMWRNLGPWNMMLTYANMSCVVRVGTSILPKDQGLDRVANRTSAPCFDSWSWDSDKLDSYCLWLDQGPVAMIRYACAGILAAMQRTLGWIWNCWVHLGANMFLLLPLFL